jgi:bifunctional UDP-N-acetylglucosamine pyrophosphorylase / glucosamine-1-phosphate N-acetyltransferase
MNRVMIVPAAGRGSRLGSPLPKLLVPVNGRPMIEYILDRYAPVVSQFVLVVSPAAEAQVLEYCRQRVEGIDVVRQESPTGMLDAILVPCERVRTMHPDQVWVTWCDQVAVQETTVRQLADLLSSDANLALGFPTLRMPEPYIHFPRNEDGTITGVLHRREGDAMPEQGEGDIGLFAMSASAYLDALPVYATNATLGAGTGERNFLPFIPWLAERATVQTVPAHSSVEAVGINTPGDLVRVAEFLARSA